MNNQYHKLPIRVYYEDTDAQGIVFYANYLRYTERARTEMLRHGHFEHATNMVKTGQMFVVRHLEISYHASALLDDMLIVKTHVAKIGGASALLIQNIYKEDTLLIETNVTIVCVDQDSKPTRIPNNARDALKQFLIQE